MIGNVLSDSEVNNMLRIIERQSILKSKHSNNKEFIEECDRMIKWAKNKLVTSHQSLKEETK